MSAHIAEWYRAFDCQGDIEAILQLLEDRIAREKPLRTYIQGTCVQVVDPSKREFILYLGIQRCPRPHLPEKVMERLLALDRTPLPNSNGSGSRRIKFRSYIDCGNHEMKPVIEDWLKKTSGKIIYRSPEPIRELDFDANDVSGSEVVPFSSEADPSNYLLEETARYDHLLLLLSAKGEGSTETFGNYCAALWANALREHRPKPAHVLRRLRLLGHIVTAPDGGKWRMLPPLLVRVSDPEPESIEATYTLVGKRDENLLSTLREGFGVLRSEPQPLGDGPATQSVQVSTAGLEEAIHALGIGVCDDYEACIEASLPTFAAWRDSLQSFTLPALYDYELRLFNGESFQRVTFEGVSGLYELWTLQSEGDPGRLWRTLFYDETRNVWLSGDWYGLRFLSHVLRSDGGLLIHRGMEMGCEAVCSQAGRLPEVYERALVIASGRLPSRRDNGRGGARLAYTDVPCDIAAIVARKSGMGFTSMKYLEK